MSCRRALLLVGKVAFHFAAYAVLAVYWVQDRRREASEATP